MYLTRMELDTNKRKMKKAIFSPNLIHGAVESAFPGERKRNLWRIDHLYGRDYLMLLSENIPQMDDILKQFGKENIPSPWLTKDYSTLLSRIKSGTQWHFRLVANPTRKVSNTESSRGAVCAHQTLDFQKNWLLQQSIKHGFRLDPDAFSVTGSQWYHFRKGKEKGRKVSFLGVSYEGILTVTDENKFCELLCQGIGRGKAYGMGLMTIAA